LNKDASDPFKNCPPDQLYTVETVLEATIPFVRATMNAAGWAAESKAGYTLAALFEKQLKHIKWIRKQGDMAVVSLLLHAHKAFLRALADCETAHMRMLSHPEPAAAKLDYLLEFNGPYDEALKEKTKGMAPMVLIRRALPELLPPSADRSLSGVRLEAPSASATVVKSGKGGGDGGGGGKGKGRDDGKGKDKDDEDLAPGVLKGIVKWTDKTHMKLGSLVYDTAKIAKHYSLDDDHCFPVLLSTKKGKAALALCPHWGKAGHESLTSVKHVAPKDWNYTHVCSHMAEKASEGFKQGNKRKRA
jgi:hypothetical protein